MSSKHFPSWFICCKTLPLLPKFINKFFNASYLLISIVFIIFPLFYYFGVSLPYGRECAGPESAVVLWCAGYEKSRAYISDRAGGLLVWGLILGIIPLSFWLLRNKILSRDLVEKKLASIQKDLLLGLLLLFYIVIFRNYYLDLFIGRIDAKELFESNKDYPYKLFIFVLFFSGIYLLDLYLSKEKLNIKKLIWIIPLTFIIFTHFRWIILSLTSFTSLPRFL